MHFYFLRFYAKQKKKSGNTAENCRWLFFDAVSEICGKEAVNDENLIPETILKTTDYVEAQVIDA